MIKWRVGKFLFIKEDDIEGNVPRIRMNRRMDIMVALEFLCGKRDNCEGIQVDEAMYIQGIGYVELGRYLFYLEFGVKE